MCCLFFCLPETNAINPSVRFLSGMVPMGRSLFSDTRNTLSVTALQDPTERGFVKGIFFKVTQTFKRY